MDGAETGILLGYLSRDAAWQHLQAMLDTKQVTVNTRVPGRGTTGSVLALRYCERVAHHAILQPTLWSLAVADLS